jgi:preprotein translocase subunit SecF
MADNGNDTDTTDAITDDTDAELTETGAVDLTDSTELPHHSFFTRLYTGTGAFEVIGRRKMWFAISAAILLVAIASIAIRWFSFGIDFEGGSKVSMPASGATTTQVQQVFHQALGKDAESVVIVGNGASATVQIRTEKLNNDETGKLSDALFEKFHPVGDNGQPDKQTISQSDVSSTWGGQITKKALIALLVFVVIVTIYIAIRYERYMAAAAIATMFFDLLTTAGVYSLVGFEVSPATVIGLLTILGFSLYDTVIVFDKVEENTHGFEHTTRRTFAEQANLAVNQTFMRSINTSLISVLPVLALVVVAVWLLGVGTLKDLALVQLVGIIVGTYSSIFFATPLLVTMRERTEKVRTHTRRVTNRRKKAAGSGATAAEVDASDGAEPVSAASGATARSALATGAPAPSKPAPGVRPSRPATSRTGRPMGKRNSRRG